MSEEKKAAALQGRVLYLFLVHLPVASTFGYLESGKLEPKICCLGPRGKW